VKKRTKQGSDMTINSVGQKPLYVKQVQATQGPQKARNRAVKTQQQRFQSSDSVDLSPIFVFMQQVTSAMDVTEPDTALKINILKQQVQMENYEVDPGRVAEKMMTDLIKDLGRSG